LSIDPTRIAGVVVTYFPDDGLAARLTTISALVERLIVIDNSAEVEVAASIQVICDRLGADLVCNPRNIGLAAALNRGVDYARDNRCDSVLFFDQDTVPEPCFREKMKSIVATYAGDAPLGIVGANYLLTRFPTTIFHTHRARQAAPADHVITSGSLYDLAMIDALGPFRDDFFIDGIDIEYGWRAMTKGYAVLRSVEPLMRHDHGRVTRHVLFGKTFGTMNYPAFRHYFIGRNSAVLFRAYLTRLPTLTLGLLFKQVKSAGAVVLFEADKLGKLKSMAMGLLHGMVGSMDHNPLTRAQRR